MQGQASEFLSQVIDPFARVRLGLTDLLVTRLGLGGASIGGLFEAVTDEDARATVNFAWNEGIRYFDVAPLYGYGNAERRLGSVLRGKPRDEFTLSTKVGRLLRIPPPSEAPSGTSEAIADLDVYRGTPPERPVYDYSYDGVMRSVAESLERLGLDRVDILFIHDPDEHWEAAISGAYPALHRLREQGVVRAIGAGMNQAAMLARFARETDMDVFLCAGRYTLLDQSALDELLPICLQKQIAIVIGGVMNSGLLADPRRSARFDYVAAKDDRLAQVAAIGELCERHGIPLRAAAIQFPLSHPAVASVVAGVRSSEHVRDSIDMMRVPIPGDFWAALREGGYLSADAPLPGDDAL